LNEKLNLTTARLTRPYVNAGPDQTILLPASAQLNGVAVDDGLPNGTLAIQWSKVSGPGTVAFSNRAAAVTQASFSMAGTYVLQLSANDPVLVSNSTVTIIVGKLNGHASNSGTDFWLMFPECYLNSCQPELIIAADVNNSGTISIPGLSFTKNFTLVGGQTSRLYQQTLRQRQPDFADLFLSSGSENQETALPYPLCQIYDG
jgi:K319-like protein